MVELLCHPKEPLRESIFSTTTSPSSSLSGTATRKRDILGNTPSNRANSDSGTGPVFTAARMYHCTQRLQTRVASLQRGIRSKVEQTARFMIVQQLKKDIAERHQAITKIESVLQSVGSP